MAALVSSEASNTDKVVTHISEARAGGIEVLPPNVNESQAAFTALALAPEPAAARAAQSGPPASPTSTSGAPAAAPSAQSRPPASPTLTSGAPAAAPSAQSG